MNILFLDESGDHSLSVIDPQYPVFVLGGVIVRQAYADGESTNNMREFKRKLFGRDDIILHTADISRARNGFEMLKEPSFRAQFYIELNNLMRGMECVVVACVIKKGAYLKKYGLTALDPYMMSFEVLAERFYFETGSDSGTIVAERRGPTLDHQLELAWLDLRIRGTPRVRPAALERRIPALVLRAKSENIAGLQLADLVVSPIARHALGKKPHEDIGIILDKLARRHGGDAEPGLVILSDD